MSSDFPREFPAPTVGALLRLALAKFRARLYSAVLDAGFDDLQPSEALAFRYPTIAGLRPGQLGSEMGLSKQAVNGLLRQLEAKGYLQLDPDPADGRSRRIVLTDRGSALMEVLRDAAALIAADWARVVGRKRLDIVRETLLQFVAESPTAGEPKRPGRPRGAG